MPFYAKKTPMLLAHARATDLVRSSLSGANISVGVGEEGGLGRGAECIAVSMWTLRRREGKENTRHFGSGGVQFARQIVHGYGRANGPEKGTHPAVLQGDPSDHLKSPVGLVPTVLTATVTTYCPGGMAQRPKSK